MANKRKHSEDEFPALKNDLILRAARGERTERVPVWIMRQAGRYLPEFRKVRESYDFFTMCRTPSVAAEITIQPIERYGDLLSAAIIFSDILVVPQALGMTVEMLPAKGPHFPNPLNDPVADVDRVLSHPVNVDIDLAYVYEAIRETRMRLNGRVPLFGFAGAPWTLLAYMIEGGGSKTLQKAKGWLFKYPETCHKLLKHIANVCIDFLVGQANAGAQILQVFDSWGGELSPSDFKTFSLPYIAQIFNGVRARSSVPMVVFARGANESIAEVASIGYDVVSVDWCVDPVVARERAGDKVTLQGNEDPSLLYADADVIRDRVRSMVSKFGTSNYIGNLGHGMYPDHDPEKLNVYLEAIRDVSLEMNSMQE